MFTDITGFSAMMQSDEVFAMRIRNRHRDIFKKAHDQYGGQILQYYGDGTLSIFDSTVSAVECAVDMQLSFQREPAVPLRIGIHAGDISYDDEGAYGDGLNIAARVERLCSTGSIFVTAKVYDDIKNHAWLRAVSMGVFQLRNIFNEVEIFAITSRGVHVPSQNALEEYPEFERNEENVAVEKGAESNRSKHVAWILALTFGVFGVHRLYLGKKGQGIANLVIGIISIIALLASDGDAFPIIMVLGILSFVDAVLLFVMPKSEFDHRYNMGIAKAGRRERKQMRKIKKAEERAARRAQKRESKAPKEEGTFSRLKDALKHYDRGDYQNAIRHLEQLLVQDDNDLVVHYYLSCCFSITRDKQDAYYHLAKAVECGFDDYDRILTDPGLSYLRSLPGFQAFKDNGYLRVAGLPVPEEDLLQTDRLELTPFEQIEMLGDRMESGEISREQFEVEKKKILGDE